MLPFSAEKLENLILKMSPLRGRVRGVDSDQMEAARELGGGLFQAVFSGEVLACLRSSLDEASSQDNVGLRLKLRLQDVSELADLPWEFLFDQSLNRFIAQSNYTPVVRYMEIPQRIRPLAIQLPLRILVMISSPDDPSYAKLDVGRERARLEQALEPLTRDRRVIIDWLEEATLAELQRRLRAQQYHVFHFIGHGGFDRQAQEGVLVLEDAQHRGWRVSPNLIGPLLHDHRSLRLAVLNSCEGAQELDRGPLRRHGLEPDPAGHPRGGRDAVRDHRLRRCHLRRRVLQLAHRRPPCGRRGLGSAQGDPGAVERHRVGHAGPLHALTRRRPLRGNASASAACAGRARTGPDPCACANAIGNRARSGDTSGGWLASRRS